jgi:hypothetical protein
MNKLMLKESVCIVSDAEVQRCRDRHGPDSRLPFSDHLWRLVTIDATKEVIVLQLQNVDARAASGGYYSGGSACRTHRLTWDDLTDVEGLKMLLRFEQVCVFQLVEEMFDKLRAHMRPLRLALAA